MKKPKIPAKIIKYLEKAGISHELLEHRVVYTAFDTAMTLRRKFDEIAKPLIVQADKFYYLVLLPADHNLNFDKLKKEINKLSKQEIKTIKIPTEKVIANIVDKGAGLAGFGGIYQLPVILEKKFSKVKKLVVPAGNFTHSVEIAVKDFIKLENAFLAAFGDKKKIKIAKPKVKAKIKTKTIAKKTKKKIKPKKK